MTPINAIITTIDIYIVFYRNSILFYRIKTVQLMSKNWIKIIYNIGCNTRHSYIYKLLLIEI